MPLLDFIPRRKEKPKFVFTPKVIFRPRYEPLRKLFTDARKKLKTKITSEKELLKFFKKEREQVIKSIKEEKVPKKLKLLRKQKNLLRTLIVNKAVRKEFLRRIVVKERIILKKVKIKVRAYTRMFSKKVRVRAYTRMFRGKKVRVRAHTRMFRGKKIKVRAYTRIFSKKIKVRAYTRMFRGKKVRVRAHTRTIKKKAKITKTYLKLG
jgi:hypothetical protein